jgi:energy-coupling factor transporter ATP-binding protein EcfA2
LHPRLTLENASYSYPLPGRGEVPALSDISLGVEPAEILCVGGANGSGKSTLAQVCAGLLVPSSGSVYYEGKKVNGRKDLLELRKKIGLLFQSPEDQLFANTVEKDISFGPHNHGLRGDDLKARVSQAAALFDLSLDELGGRSPFSLSGGEKRRVALAGVFALEPEVLVLDEPFIGMDFDSRKHMQALLGRLRENNGTSIIIITHELSGSWSLADRYALLAAGRLERLQNRAELVSSGADLGTLGLRLPQWGLLANRLERMGVVVEDPADPRALARALCSIAEVGDGR